jgi:hypothetical protein
MSYLQDAMLHLGIYYTPARILALGTSSGKTTTQFPVANPPFSGGIQGVKRKRDTLTIEVNGLRPACDRPGGTFLYRQRADTPTILESRAYRKGSRWQFLARYDTAEEARAALFALSARGGDGAESAKLELGKGTEGDDATN